MPTYILYSNTSSLSPYYIPPALRCFFCWPKVHWSTDQYPQPPALPPERQVGPWLAEWAPPPLAPEPQAGREGPEAETPPLPPERQRGRGLRRAPSPPDGSYPLADHEGAPSLSPRRVFPAGGP